ncbi:alpha-ketoglutarate-dependent dioxygenase AlkB [Paraburkholderia sp. SIMBA_030]|uniref:alpha-ketoglutarate-dependent dioxygenase AlkB n=1 Tax=Paraburkholderia sp. SIMBA_030 TaxID=3085773 RepID=UPI00397CFB8E
MDWLSPEGAVVPTQEVAGAVSPRLSFVLDSRDWLRFVADEWWPSPFDADGLSLGVEAVCDHLKQGGRISVVVWIDSGQLPSLPAAIYRSGQWIDAPVHSVTCDDKEVLWPGPIHLSSVTAFSVPTEADRARLVAMAKGFSNVEMPAQPVEVKPTPQILPAANRPQLTTLYRAPAQWDSIRGAAAMAVWAVPAIDPWLDVLCESLSTGATRENAATALGAPWLGVPLWARNGADALGLPLWAAIREVIGAVNYREEWRPAEVLETIVDSAAQLGADGAALAELRDHTQAILSDAAVIDVRRAERDPLGLALQLVLLRPKAENYVSWVDDLPSMPPAVWWTGAMLSGLLTGMRDLDKQFRGSPAAREILAVRTWHLSSVAGSATRCWPDRFAPKPSWVLGSDKVQFLDGDRPWADRKTSRRGEWFRADFDNEPTYKQALELARRLHPSSLRRCLRIADAELTASGSGKLSVDKTGHRLKVKGELSLALNDSVSFADELDVDHFRDWIAIGSVAERLPSPPRAVLLESIESIQPAASVSGDPAIGQRVLQPVRLPDDPPGLLAIPDFISGEQELALLAEVDRGTWLTDLSRRVQHYGWKYDYKARMVESSGYLGPLPGWAADLAERLLRHGVVGELPDQVIVNEYVASQGIAKHIDCPGCFRGAVVTISLGESWGMLFRSPDGVQKVERVLQRRSAVVLDGEVREEWTHEIPKRKKEGTALRGRRISLTFRKVNPRTTKAKGAASRKKDKGS